MCDGTDNDCDGVTDNDEQVLGEDALCPALDCNGLREARPDLPDGIYFIESESGQVSETLCDMTTDGGGWTLVQRTVWEWNTESRQLMTGIDTWLEETIGDPAAGHAYRLAGEQWPEINVEGEVMLSLTPRLARTGEDCDTLHYKAEDISIALVASGPEVTGTGTTANNIFHTAVSGTQHLSTADSGPFESCINTFDAVPWFYANCCSTCPTLQGFWWADTLHPMVIYTDDTADMDGLIESDVCDGEPQKTVVGSTYDFYTGINDMSVFLR